MKTLYKILFTAILGLFTAGMVSASLGEYWSTISHLVPRTNDTVDVGSTAKRVRALFSNDLTFYDEIKPDNATCSNGQILKKTGADDWDCAADATGAGGSAITFDIGDDGGDDSTDVNEIATTGDTNTIFTEPSADKILIAVGNNWPTADTATTASALVANGGNCSAGNSPLGADASGAVEGCFDVWTEAENTAADYIPYTGATKDINFGAWEVTTDTIISKTEIAMHDSASYTFYSDAGSTLLGTLDSFNVGVFNFKGSGAGDKIGKLDFSNLATTDKTFTFPNFSGTFITSGNLTDITAVGTVASGTWNGTALTSSYIGSDEILESHLKAVDTAADEECLTYESTTGDFEWQVCSAGSGDVTDVFDCSTGDCNTMTVGTSEYLTYGTGYIDANRFAGVTTIDGTEFGYLNSVSSNIQTQLNGKEGTLTNSAGLASALSDETGTGVAVFGTSPTFTTGVNLPAGSIDTATEISADIITHTQILDADQTDTKCLYFEDPVATDDFNSIWRNSTANAFQITEIWAESDQTVTFMLQVDDGSPADCDTVDLAPAAGEAEDTSLNGDCLVSASEELDLAVTSVASTPTWASICFTGQWVD